MADIDNNEEDLEGDYTRNPPELNGVEDLSHLVFLEMGNVLDNLIFRYQQMKNKHIYTSLSTILIAVNPYEMLPIYSRDHIEHYFDQAQNGRPLMPPHPFAVGARSNTRLLQREHNQSVIVCGESGAGKTETTKLVIRYLAETTPGGDDGGAIEMQIMAASPILEAFGNAKTILNNNSSRFGKFTKLLYNMGERDRTRGEIVGSTLETYLLEKSRVVFQSPNERNYHSFYFVNAGLTEQQKEEWGITDLTDFHYVNQGGNTKVPGISDIARFEELETQMKVMRIEAEEQLSIWKMVMAIMHLGNVKFVKDSQDFAICDPATDHHLAYAAQLFGVETDDLRARLTSSTMKVGRKNLTKNMQFKSADPNRDSISKGAYENTFLYLAKRINAELCNLDEDIDKFLFIGVLDVFGFENFKYNSLEQFCINFTNEKLQEFFNYHIIRAEQEEYIRESVVWTEIEVPSSQMMLDLVEKKVVGLFAILDSSCQAPQPDVAAFHQEFFKKNGDCPIVTRWNKKRARNFYGAAFTHFADTVKYDLREFIAKNNEKLHNDTKRMFNKSTDPMIKNISGGKIRKKRGFTSVTGLFSKQLSKLMNNLKATEPYFVRCVNPNKKKSGDFVTRKVLEDQLRCGGIIEALRVLKLGYPTRVSYEILYQKYHPRIEHPLIKRMGPDKFAAAILIAFGVSEDEYELGLTKIFFRPAKAQVLDEIMSQADNLDGDQLQRVVEWLAQRRKLQLFGMLKISRFYDKQIRHNRAMERWDRAGHVISNTAYSFKRFLTVARELIEERRRDEASTVIASYWRTFRTKKKFEKDKKKTKRAIRKLWKAHIDYTHREAVLRWCQQSTEATRIRLEKEAAERRRKEEEERKRREEEERLEAERIQREMEAASEAERLKLEEEDRIRKAKLEEERLERERIQAEERKREAEEKARREREAAEKKEREEAERREQEELERQEREREAEENRQLRVEEAMHKQREKSVVVDRKQAEKRRKDKQARAKRKIDKINRRKEQTEDDEYEERMKKREADMEKNHIIDNNHEYSDEESSSTDEYEPMFSQEPQSFKRIAANGTLFMKHTGRKKNRAPQDRFVKVTFRESDHAPTRVSWGSGSRHLEFSDIRLIAWGHHSPTFMAKAKELDPRMCFSIVSQTSILDLQNTDVRVVEQWVHGLRNLIGQTDEDATQLSTELRQNPPRQRPRRRDDEAWGGSKPERKQGGGDKPRKSVRSSKRDSRRRGRRQSSKQAVDTEHKKRTKSLMLLQQDLFVMTTTTVFRNLEEDDYPITQRLKDSFNPKEMYEKALANDVPWRQWQNWIHEQILQKMIDEGSIPPPNQSSSGAHQGSKEGSGTLRGTEEEMTQAQRQMMEQGGRDRAPTNADCSIQ